MSYYDEEIGAYINADPHEDVYFPEDEEESQSPELILALDTLSERERFVIELRCGLRAGALGVSFTQQEIADLMGVDRSTVSRIEDKAVEKCQNALKTQQ